MINRYKNNPTNKENSNHLDDQSGLRSTENTSLPAHIGIDPLDMTTQVLAQLSQMQDYVVYLDEADHYGQSNSEINFDEFFESSRLETSIEDAPNETVPMREDLSIPTDISLSRKRKFKSANPSTNKHTRTNPNPNQPNTTLPTDAQAIDWVKIIKIIKSKHKARAKMGAYSYETITEEIDFTPIDTYVTLTSQVRVSEFVAKLKMLNQVSDHEILMKKLIELGKIVARYAEKFAKVFKKPLTIATALVEKYVVESSKLPIPAGLFYQLKCLHLENSYVELKKKRSKKLSTKSSSHDRDQEAGDNENTPVVPSVQSSAYVSNNYALLFCPESLPQSPEDYSEERKPSAARKIGN